MKIRIVIVPPDKVDENHAVEGDSSIPRLQLQEDALNDVVSLRHLIQTCQPMASRMDSWNELDKLQSTAWLCMHEGTGAREWMWNGKDGIHDPGEFEHHDFEITFEEVGEPPTEGLQVFTVKAENDKSLEDVLLPPDEEYPFFPRDIIEGGETRVHYEIYGRVPNEWDEETELTISLTATSWTEVDPVAEDTKPFRENNTLFLERLRRDQED